MLQSWCRSGKWQRGLGGASSSCAAHGFAAVTLPYEALADRRRRSGLWGSRAASPGRCNGLVGTQTALETSRGALERLDRRAWHGVAPHGSLLVAPTRAAPLFPTWVPTPSCKPSRWPCAARSGRARPPSKTNSRLNFTRSPRPSRPRCSSSWMTPSMVQTGRWWRPSLELCPQPLVRAPRPLKRPLRGGGEAWQTPRARHVGGGGGAAAHRRRHGALLLSYPQTPNRPLIPCCLASCPSPRQAATSCWSTMSG